MTENLVMLPCKRFGRWRRFCFSVMISLIAASNEVLSTLWSKVSGFKTNSEGAQEKITKYLTLIPLIHFTQVFRRFKEEDTQINENWNLNASYESDIPGLVAESIDEFTGNRFQSNAHLFTYEQIVKMTFKFKTILGRGGFGRVYHGFLEDGTDVAIKLQTQSTPWGDREFLAELRSLTRVCHNNLISLIGYCNDGGNHAIVYEYMPQGNLRHHLRGKVAVLTWAQRLQIAYQAAQGLDYLHTGCNPPIVHRDVKSSNILLGANLEAKITDFGISKALNENDTDETTEVVGTCGYVDPEYADTYHYSDASDVYSFGIILLEMITGQPPIIRGSEVEDIVQWVTQRADHQVDFLDTRMNKYCDRSSVWKVFKLALSCTNKSASRRPRMVEVVIQLEEIIEMTLFKYNKDMENEQVEEAFITSIAQAGRPVCMHRLPANLFTSWTHTPGRRFWRCKNQNMADDCGYFEWHDLVQENATIEQMDFVIHQIDELDEEIQMMDEERAILFSKVKALDKQIAECMRSKEALEKKSDSMYRFY